MYMRDMMPSMLGIFVARGKRELASHRGRPESSSPLPAPSSSEVRQKMEEGLGMAAGAAAGGVGLAKDVAAGGVGIARDVAGTALAGFLQWRSSLPAPATGAPAGAAWAPPRTGSAPAPGAAAPSPSTAAAPPASGPATPPASSWAAATAAAPDVDSLPIPDYDELSASQVVERLAGLDAASLERIRHYESAHRARTTILGKIAQLS
jgi:hypothetical protein